MDDNILGKRIKQLRNEANLTQEEFGIPYNIKKSTVSQYESGSSRPDDELKKRIASDYNVSLDWLMGRTDNRNNTERISNAVSDDPELEEFWATLKDRPDLQLLFKQTKDLADKDIKQILKIIKTFEDEEDLND